MRNRWNLLWILLAVVLVAGCSKKAEPAAAAAKADPYKVAFVYIGPPGDLGTHEHDNGPQGGEAEFGDKLKAVYIENVPEGPDATRIIRQYAQEGYGMIFGHVLRLYGPHGGSGQDFRT
jgi:basic membrane lipoprotein Med (substrate-binding protein (PBP1-ABC) superfamily)